MKKKNAADNSTEKLLLESRGLPTRITVHFVLFIFVLTLICIYHYMYAQMLPPDMNKTQEYLVIFCTAFVIMGSILMLMDGRKSYIKIYENHIEGCAGYSVMSREVNMPIDEICYVYPDKRGVMPSLVVLTTGGSRLSFLMNARKAVAADRILKEKIMQQEENGVG